MNLTTWAGYCNWHLVEGGDELLHSGTRGIVGFKNEGPRIQDSGAYAGIPGKGGTPVHAIPRGKTDKDGVASICLQGKPHVPYIVKTADGTARATVYIASRGAAGYNILIEPDKSPIAGKEEWKTVHHFPECPLWERANSHSEEPRLRPFYLPRIEFLATYDPNNPGIIWGTLIERDARSDGTVTYKWDLQRCDTYEDKPQRCN